jgi:hypothetical protein
MGNFIDKIQISGTSYDVKDVSAVSVVNITQADYDELPESAKTENILYNITDAPQVDISQFWTSAQTNSAINEAVSGKQDTLSAGTGIDITNNVISVTGGGGGGGKAIEAGRGIDVTTGATADTISIGLPISAGTGTNSLILGYYNSEDSYWNSQANGEGSLSCGVRCVADGWNTSFAIGYQNKSIGGNGSFAHGYMTYASGKRSHSEGLATSATSDASHSEGNETTASGMYSHAEGWSTTANGQGAHAEGQATTASGNYSHAEGWSTTANSEYSHAEGAYTLVYGGAVYAHAEGRETSAMTDGAHAEGCGTKALNYYEHAQGWYNVSNTGSTDADTTIFSVGNGTADDARHNAFEIRKNGDIYISSSGTDIKLQDNLGGGGTVDQTVISGSTNAVAGGAVYDQLSGMKIVKLTESEYAALVTKDADTLYVVIPDPSN